MAASIVNVKWFRGAYVSTIILQLLQNSKSKTQQLNVLFFCPNSATAERQLTDTADSNINKLRLKF